MKVEQVLDWDPDLPPTPLVSPSQITTFRACQRKWALEKLAGLRSRSTPSQELGTDVDDHQLQPYLRDGRPFDFTKANKSGDIAASGLKYLPQPKSPGLEVQRHFVMPSPSSTPGEYAPFAYQGYLDLWLPLRGMPDMPIVLVPIPIVSDFKTMKDLKWAKTAAQLEKDPQAMIYAAWAMYFTGARVVDLAWINLQTQGARKATRTTHRVDAAHVAAELLELDRTAQEIMRTRAELEGHEDKQAAALSLEPSPSECKAYAGCPHEALCNLSPLQIIDGLAAQAARRKGLPIVSNTPATSSLLERMRAKKAAADGATPPPPTHFGSPETAPAPTEIPAAFLPTPSVGINPPESALPPAPPVGTAAPAAPAPASPPPRRGRPPKAPGEPAAPPPPTLNAGADEGETVTVTWAEERFCPVPYQSFGVGPFTYTTKVKPGETFDEAFLLADAKLAAIAIVARSNKLESFKSALGGAT